MQVALNNAPGGNSLKIRLFPPPAIIQAFLPMPKKTQYNRRAKRNYFIPRFEYLKGCKNETDPSTWQILGGKKWKAHAEHRPKAGKVLPYFSLKKGHN